MHGLELGDMPRGESHGRLASARRRLGRPGSVDVLAVRSVAGVPTAARRLQLHDRRRDARVPIWDSLERR